jgi:cation diffusion facilitator CzcD-associated flavoprotein CzcO
MSRQTLRRTAIAALLSCAVVAANPADAQTRTCGERERIVHILADRYGETVRSRGLASATQVIEVYASEETGSWTITVTTPDGRTCLLASGQAYQAHLPTALGDEV